MVPLMQALQGWGVPELLALLLAAAVPVGVVGGIAMGLAGFTTYVERKVAADIQLRVGVNQCNPGSFVGVFLNEVVLRGRSGQAGLAGRLAGTLGGLVLPLVKLADSVIVRFAPGLMIFMVDGLKLLMKEDLIPAAADRPFFKLAPVVVLASAMGALACLPYSDQFYVADFNIGIFYLAAITSLEVIGILMAGWASNNKWALLGGMRAAAQIVSYEVPAGMAILTVVLMGGTLSMQGLCLEQFGPADWQQGWIWQWNLFSNPVLLVLAPIYFIAGLAECNRTPFDIPEAESELVAGFHIEYSGIRFGFFNMAENIMMWVISGVAVTLFLGGWSTGIGILETKVFAINGDPSQGFHVWASAIHLAAFAVKTYALVFLMMWIRWTLPRYRVDQLMDLCWKKLMPLALVCFTAASLWILAKAWLVQSLTSGNRSVEAARGLLDEVLGVGALLVFVALTSWLVWYFTRPINPAEQERRGLLPQSGVGRPSA